MDKELAKEGFKYVFYIIIAIVAIKVIQNMLQNGTKSLLSGDVFKSSDEKATDKAVKDKMLATNWFAKELALPANQKTTITRGTAFQIANQLHSELRNTVQTMTGANQIYTLLSKIGTTGSLYYLFGEFGVRDGMDLPTYLYTKVGFNNSFSKDLDEVNAMYAKRGIKFKF